MPILQNMLKQDFFKFKTERPSPIGENKKVIKLWKVESGGNIITKFVGLRP